MRERSKHYSGRYLNAKSTFFRDVLESGIFVDKSKLLEQTNRVICTSSKLICMAMPRRFGKTLTASMLANYYSCGADSSALFQDLAIASSPNYETHLNQYHVISIDFLQASQDLTDLRDSLQHVPKGRRKQHPDYASMPLLTYIKFMIETELTEAFPGCADRIGGLSAILQDIHRNAPDHPRFVFVIDEWDHLFRSNAPEEEQRAYSELLCYLFMWSTNQAHLALVYLTGRCPINQYRTGPLGACFHAYSMVEPLRMGEFMGFTEAEVQKLCLEHNVPFHEMKRWYDGYRFESAGSVYNPYSVTEAIRKRTFSSYWTETDDEESLRACINTGKSGLKQTIALLVEGEPVLADTWILPREPRTRDDVLTQLVLLGYLRCLTHPPGRSTLSIPNWEIMNAFRQVTKSPDWAAVFQSLNDSALLLQETWEGDSEAVAQKVAAIHLDYTSSLDYNDAHSLSSVLKLAYFTARNEYKIIQEEDTALGRADLFFQPKPKSAAIPMIVELKWDKTFQSAMDQVKAKKYRRNLSEYPQVLLVGITYDPTTGRHDCVIETRGPR